MAINNINDKLILVVLIICQIQSITYQVAANRTDHNQTQFKFQYLLMVNIISIIY